MEKKKSVMECHLKANLNNNDIKVAFQRKENQNWRSKVIELDAVETDFRQEMYFTILNSYRKKDVSERERIISKNFPKIARFLEGFPAYPNKAKVTETAFLRVLDWWLRHTHNDESIPSLCKDIRLPTTAISDVVKIIRTLCFLDANENHDLLNTQVGDTIRMEYACTQAGKKYSLIVILAISVTTLNVRLCHFLAEIDPSLPKDEEALISREEILKVLGASISKEAKIVVSEECLKRILLKRGFSNLEVKPIVSHQHGFHFRHFVQNDIKKMFDEDNLCDPNLLEILITEFAWRQNLHSDDERFCKVLSCLDKVCEKIDENLTGETMYRLLNVVADNAGHEKFNFSSLEATLFHRPLSSHLGKNVPPEKSPANPDSSSHHSANIVPNGNCVGVKRDLVSEEDEREVIIIDDSSDVNDVNLSASGPVTRVPVTRVPVTPVPVHTEIIVISSESSPAAPTTRPYVQAVRKPAKRGRKPKARNHVADAIPELIRRSGRCLRSNSKKYKEITTSEADDEKSTDSSSQSPPKRSRTRILARKRSPDPESDSNKMDIDIVYYAQTCMHPLTSLHDAQNVQNWNPVQCPYCPPSNKNGLIDKNIYMIPHLLIHHCKRNEDDNLWEFRQSECTKKVSNAKTCFVCCETTECGIIASHMSSVHQKDVQSSCCICEKDFSTSIDQKRHFKEHHIASEMPYWCPICDAKSSFRYDIIDHYSVYHTTEQKVLCPFCLNAYRYETEDDRNVLESHILRHKNEFNIYTCIKCTLNFVSQDEYNVHQDRNHQLVFTFFQGVRKILLVDEAKVVELWKAYIVGKPKGRKRRRLIGVPERKSVRQLRQRLEKDRSWEELNGPNSNPNESKTQMIGDQSILLPCTQSNF